MGVTEGKLERFRNEWNTRKLSLQRKNKYYEEIKVTEKVRSLEPPNFWTMTDSN